MAAGDPTGADLCVGTTNGNTLPFYADSYEEREITLGAGTALTSGLKYAICVRVLSGDASNHIAWVLETLNPYAGGVRAYSFNAGTTWSQSATNDMRFITKAGAVEKDSYTGGDDSSETYAYGNTWQGQTFTATSSYTVTSVVLRIGRLGSPGTVTVSIRATDGAPSKATTPSPTDANTSVTLDQATISWVDGGTSDSFDVYYGDTSGSLSLVSSAQAGLSYTVTGTTLGSPYDYIITRYWRIDSNTEGGTVTGDEWSFTTLRFSPPGVTYWYPTTNIYYRLLVQDDGTYGDHPPTGVADTDYVVVTYEPNFIRTNRVLVAIAENRFWYEDIT